MADAIVKILSDLYFNDRTMVECGPDRKKVAYFSDVHHKAFIEGRDAKIFPILVPDSMYRPEIYFAIDFTHQFTISDTDESGEKIKGERPVPAEILQKTATELVKFFYYYFSNGFDSSQNIKVQNAINSSRSLENEESQSLFVNHILNFFATGFGIDRSVGQVGTASISLKDMNSLDIRGQGQRFRLLYDKTMGILNQILAPMLPVGIWARGRFYKNWFFPQFDGYITNVSYSVNQGFADANITCRDQLELARISYEMLNPSIIQPGEIRKKFAINIFDKPFYNIDHFEIIGGMFKGGEIKFDPKDGGRILSIDTTQKNSRKTQSKKSNYVNFQGLGNFEIAIDSDTSDDQRELGNNLRDVVQNEAIHVDSMGGDYIRYFLKKTSHKERSRYVVGWGTSITPYRVWGTQATDTFSSQFGNRLEIIQKVAKLAYYNIYADRSGNIQYHPMRLGNRYLSDICMIAKNIASPEYVPTPFPGVQVVTDHERFSGVANLNIEELCTFMHLEGQAPFVPGETFTKLALVGSATEKEYLARYGYRRREEQNPLFNYAMKVIDRNTGKEVNFLDAAAEALLKFSNAELYTRQESIVYRPEMDIARPVYIPETDEVFYAQSLSISVNIGSDATTGINMNLGRKFDDPPPDLMSFLEDSETFYKIYTTDGDATKAIITHNKYLMSADQIVAERKARDKAKAEAAAKATETKEMLSSVDAAIEAQLEEAIEESKEKTTRNVALANARRKDGGSYGGL